MVGFKLFSFLAALPAVVLCLTHYERPVQFVFAFHDGKALPYNDTTLLSYFDQVKPGVTALVPFLSNVADPDKYTYMIKEVHKRNITIVPGVGRRASEGRIDQPRFKDIAKGYKKHSEHIRLDHMQEQYDKFGRDPIQAMVEYCVSLGFKHIMMNPWPLDNKGQALKFDQCEVDAYFSKVLLDKNNTTHEPITNATNWYPDVTKIDAVKTVKPDVRVLVHYEARLQQDVLTQIEKQQAGASLTAMQITLDQIVGKNQTCDLHWTPPLDRSYNSVALGTWSWIAGQLSNIA